MTMMAEARNNLVSNNERGNIFFKVVRSLYKIKSVILDKEIEGYLVLLPHALNTYIKFFRACDRSFGYEITRKEKKRNEK